MLSANVFEDNNRIAKRFSWTVVRHQSDGDQVYVKGGTTWTKTGAHRAAQSFIVKAETPKTA